MVLPALPVTPMNNGFFSNGRQRLAQDNHRGVHRIVSEYPAQSPPMALRTRMKACTGTECMCCPDFLVNDFRYAGTSHHIRVCASWLSESTGQ